MRTKNLKSHVTDHVIFCWLATSSNGHFFQYFLCFWCLTRFAENGSQVKWNKKGLGNFDGLEQKPKESNVTLITSYPSKETLFVKLLLLFTFSKLTYRFSLFNYKPKSFQISQNGWCGLFLRFLTLTSSQNIIIRQALKSWGIGDYNLSSLSKLGGSNSSLTTRFLLPRRRQQRFLNASRNVTRWTNWSMITWAQVVRDPTCRSASYTLLIMMLCSNILASYWA